MKPQDTYLVCPLNWGLGHATRMIPVIHQLIDENRKVIIGGDGDALQILKLEFPELGYIQIPDLKLNLKSGFNIFNLVRIAISVLKISIKEHTLLKSIIKDLDIDVIISDNRYGLWNMHIKSIFVTHQLMLKLPKPFKLFEGIVHQLIKRAISKFDECWVPDVSGENNLSGDLSHKYSISSKTKFIGPLSRFTNTTARKVAKTYDYVAVLSGPEPQRSQLQNKIVSIFSQSSLSCLVVEGKPSNEKNEPIVIGNVDIVPHINTNQLKTYLLNAKIIICRSGYSSIMDLDVLKRKAIIIPTDGQTEQEYLAVHLKNTHSITSLINLRKEIVVS